MDNDVIYEIGQIINGEKNLQSDMNEIGESIKNMLYEKYIKKFELAIETQRLNIEQYPTREVALLKAIKPFISESNYLYVDQIIEAINRINVAKSFQYELEKAQNQSADEIEYNSIIQSDGVYEIDERCMKGMKHETSPGFFILILLFLLMGKRK